VTSAFAAVRDTLRVPVEEAVALGLFDADDDDSPIKPDAMGEVEIPRWRHAIANIPASPARAWVWSSSTPPG
jgi:hypothetical protein